MKEFIDFLEFHNAQDKFTANLSNYKKRTVEQHFKACNTRALIDQAFTWSSTLEGHKYWQDLHNFWINFNKAKDLNYYKNIRVVINTKEK